MRTPSLKRRQRSSIGSDFRRHDSGKYLSNADDTPGIYIGIDTSYSENVLLLDEYGSFIDRGLSTIFYVPGLPPPTATAPLFATKFGRMIALVRIKGASAAKL